jgi:hypothetical protein
MARDTRHFAGQTGRLLRSVLGVAKQRTLTGPGPVNVVKTVNVGRSGTVVARSSQQHVWHGPDGTIVETQTDESEDQHD